MRIALLVVSFVSLVAVASAQVEVTGRVVAKLDDATGVKVVGDNVYLDAGTKLSSSNVILFRVETEASKTVVIAREMSQFPPIIKSPTVVSDNTYEITEGGKWWITAKVNDRQKDLWGEADLFLELIKGPGPGPDPKPPGPNPPKPDPPSPVPNAYGVGSVAYTQAPRDPTIAAKQSAIYKQAADFLFGVPSLKFVYSPNDVHNKDPNRSIFAWISSEQSKLQCSDRETCEAWRACREKLATAFVESQTKRQYTRQDWYNALNEVAKGFEAVR